jgi:hypothetical protein
MALKWALTPPNITSSSVQLVRLPPLAAIGLISFASSGSGSGKARELSWGSCVPPGSCSAVQYGGGPASGGARTHWQGTAAGQIEDSRSGTAQSRVQTSVGPVVIKYLGLDSWQTGVAGSSGGRQTRVPQYRSHRSPRRGGAVGDGEGDWESRMALTNCYGKHREGNLTVIWSLTLC